MMYGYGFGNGNGGGMSGWMIVGQLLITALVIGAVALATIVVARQLNPSLRPGGNTARAILEARYARGEIDDKEFQRRADLLSKA